jgi:hypothetical protein
MTPDATHSGIFWAVVRTVRVAHCGRCRNELITTGRGDGTLHCACGAWWPDAVALVDALNDRHVEQVSLL